MGSEAVWRDYVARNVESGRLLGRFGSPYHPFWLPVGEPKEATMAQKSILVAVRNEKRENVDFLHPSHAKSLLLGSHGGRESVPK